MQLEPYLFFNGHCDDAIAFYKTALGAEVQQLMRYSDNPDPMPPGMLPPGSEHKVMHASLSVGGKVLMLSDGRCGGKASFEGVSLSLGYRDEAQARQVFDALAQGGQVGMPLSKTFWTPLFGMVTDRFGMGWMVSLDTRPAA